ncbi:SCO family protein [Nisaea sediminum]|uniref:SCO family protein n=1 Tax=Nisaea sediminum TaxID=2775867 RepID=UPI0029BFC657|nr:SCO family protein [Nisaea sediminum]
MRRLFHGIVLALILLSGAPAARGADLPSLFGGPFSLTDETGARVGPESYTGKFMLVYFGYSYCPDICPTDLAVMGQALDSLGPLVERVQPLLISVDPERDRWETLGAFTDAFHPALMGLTGTEAEVAAAAKAYRVHRRKFRLDGAAEADYLVDHSTLTYLMGPDGRFVTMFPRGTTPERMAEVLRKYLSG